MKQKLFFLLVIAILSLSACSTKKKAVLDEPLPASAMEHVHGIFAVSSGNVYLASHHGLMNLKGDKNLYKVGTNTDDLMGFLVDPKNTNIIYISGHSNDEQDGKEDYANLGLLRSDDSGLTWKKVSDGAKDTADYHAMGISYANPSIMYGWYHDFQISYDSGVTWEELDTTLYEVLDFKGHPKEESIIYAATVNGLMISYDYGKTWDFISEKLTKTSVLTVAINPFNTKEIFAVTNKFGLLKSSDEGNTWLEIDETFAGDLVTYVTYTAEDEGILYLVTKLNSIYKSVDSGVTWIKVF